MTDHGALPANDPHAPARPPRFSVRADDVTLGGNASDAAHSRFGAAADILDRLDTRALHMRLSHRPWWRFW
jgi:hypothetical protein